ncbi:MAG: NUDIX domain-containing protein [Acidobacteriota bacterium]
MASRFSAGILMYRFRGGVAEVLIVHPGGPFWARKDLGAWSIPKGEFLPGDGPLETAKREFREETGSDVSGDFIQLVPVLQTGGKLVHAFAVEGDFDPATLVSNTFEMEWPPRSGRMKELPEVDRAEWCDFATAREKLNAAQATLIDQLEQLIRIR